MRRMITDAEIKQAVACSKSVSAVTTMLHAARSGAGNASLMNRINKLGLDTNHWGLRAKSIASKFNLSDILVVNSVYKSSRTLKIRLLKENLLQLACAECGVNGIYNNKPITLQMDHINGIRNDNRLENLRLLCPNCHSQTDTWGGKRFKKKSTNCKCGVVIGRESLTCVRCSNHARVQTTKIEWPSDTELFIMLKTHSVLGLAKKLGVSDNGIRKRTRSKRFRDNTTSPSAMG